MNAPSPTVEDRPLDQLSEWSRNPRRISKPRLEALKRALVAEPEMLQARPLIALPDGTVVAGNQRLRAARELGWPTLPTVTVDLDEARATEWALRDNRGYGEDDEALVGALLAELAADGRALDLTGYDSGEVDRLLAAVRPAPVVDPDDAPPLPAEPRSVRGEVYELGPHRLMCGDATSEADVEALLAGQRPKALLTDPPYGINLDTDYRKLPIGSSKAERALAQKRKTWRPVIGDDRPFDASALPSVLLEAREQFWFGGDYYRRTLSASDLDGSFLVWDKRDETTDVVIGSGFELIWSRQVHKRDLLRHYWCGAMGSKEARGRMHPTQKPTELLVEILKRWTPTECVVADPFLGSGSTLIACERTGRVCYGMEIDPAYCDVIRQRYADFTGQPELAP
jgi:ParB-like chromosome segregation protein Spo0J